jgi:hypothetical protein
VAVSAAPRLPSNATTAGSLPLSAKLYGSGGQLVVCDVSHTCTRAYCDIQFFVNLLNFRYLFCKFAKGSVMPVEATDARSARWLAAGGLVAMLATNSGSALAQATADQRSACTSDVFRLCSSEIPHIDRIVACLTQAKSQLSAPCAAVFSTASASGSRSLASESTPASTWCVFPGGNILPTQQDWHRWCTAGN